MVGSEGELEFALAQCSAFCCCGGFRDPTADWTSAPAYGDRLGVSAQRDRSAANLYSTFGPFLEGGAEVGIRLDVRRPLEVPREFQLSMRVCPGPSAIAARATGGWEISAHLVYLEEWRLFNAIPACPGQCKGPWPRVPNARFRFDVGRARIELNFRSNTRIERIE